jgi:hypothetical protein
VFPLRRSAAVLVVESVELIESPIDQQVGTGEVAVPIRVDEEFHCLGHVVRLTEPAQRAACSWAPGPLDPTTCLKAPGDTAFTLIPYGPSRRELVDKHSQRGLHTEYSGHNRTRVVCSERLNTSAPRTWCSTIGSNAPAPGSLAAIADDLSRTRAEGPGSGSSPHPDDLLCSPENGAHSKHAMRHACQSRGNIVGF